MSEALYNIVFDGEILDGADANAVRDKVGATFRLDGERLQNLFSGQRVVVKRDVDLLTATRFQQAFFSAGARAEIEPIAPSPKATPNTTQESPPAPEAAAPHRVPGAEPVFGIRGDTGATGNLEDLAGDALSLAPPGAPLEEIDDRAAPRQPDTSGLSLVPGNAWDLSDCAPPPAASPMFDLDAFSLAPLDDRPPTDGQ